MSNRALEATIWVLIYGGLLLGSLGLFLQRGDSDLAGSAIVVGAFAVVAGLVLIVVRSRRGP